MSRFSSNQELTAAVENLYSVFKAYPLKASTNPCICCHSEEDEKPLHSKTLRRLTKNDLYLYAAEALLVWGDADDFRHFLPRIFELMLAEDGPFVDPEIVFAKLCHAEWRRWSKTEQEAVDRFLTALWDSVITSTPSDDACAGRDLESWLCAIAHAEDDLSLYFEKWLYSSAPEATWNLAVIITHRGLAQLGNRQISAYWQDHFLQQQQVYEWLRSDVVRKKLEAGINLWPDAAFRHEIQDALYVVS